MKNMTTYGILRALATVVWLGCSGAVLGGPFSSGSTGADGTFAPTQNTALALPANGIFNFTTVNIPAGVTVTFQNNGTNTPVTILATGDVTIAGTIALAWMLQRTRAGLVLRAVGESPESAHALGYPVRRIRLLAVVVGGALCGLAGAYISVVYAPLWAEGMVAGRGWIALALTVFATWRPVRLLLGAYLFGGVTMLQLHLQAQGVQVPLQVMSMLPYLATILVLVLISRNPAWIRLNMPASLGKPFYPST